MKTYTIHRYSNHSKDPHDYRLFKIRRFLDAPHRRLMYHCLSLRTNDWKIQALGEKGNIENAAEYCSLVSGGRVSCVIMEGSGMPLVNSDSSWTPLSSRILRDELRSRSSGTVRVIFACRPQLAFKHESGELLVQFDYHYLILTTAPKDNHDRWFN